MIDEVHQLSTHAFNAMLKTLEEPPDYVKFILATTDPQKVPVTVLSRCLQFNLKQMTPQDIAARMREILAQESIAADDTALNLLAHAARGSMRDGLSLLDQAIAYAAGKVTLEAVRGMLGAIDEGTLVRVLDAVAARDAAAVLTLADEMNAQSLSFAQALRDLAGLLHRIALVQRVPTAADDEILADDVRRLARALSADEVQLYYQIALHGRNDLHLAPDEYAGFTMTLLRMLAFAPDGQIAATPPQAPGPTRVVPVRAAAAPPRVDAPATPVPVASTSTPVSDFDGDWPALVARLKVAGLVRELAQRSELVLIQGDHIRLRVPLKTLAEAGTVAKLKSALEAALGRPLRLTTEVGNTTGATAAGLAAEASAERQRQAEEAIYGDPFVRELIDNFGASVDPASIRPRDAKDTGNSR
jgi:DNA polymerase-3 subunit gamma/tau